MKTIKVFYACAAIFLVATFLALLYIPIQSAFHEQDLWWMVPLMSSITQGHHLLENLRLLFFNPYVTFQGDPWMNTYLYLVVSVLGFVPKYFIFVSMAFHFMCAFLIYSILRKLDFDFRVAFFSAFIYLTMFINFCYYIWPMAFHHLFVLFISLLEIYFYFATNKRIDSGRGWKIFFWITIFINFLAAFSQITILLLPIGILAHILISAKSGEERLKKYDIWMPLFIIYLGYPLIRLLCFGYQHLARFINIGSMGEGSVLVFPVFFLLGLGSLFLFRGILQLLRGYKLDRIFKISCVVAFAMYLLVLAVACIRHDIMVGPNKAKLCALLSPYSLIYPFCVMCMNFIAPIKSALLISPSSTYHMIPLQSNIICDIFSLLLIAIFVKKCFSKHRGLIVFVMFYIAALRYMRVDTAAIPSRHFVYTVPLFSIVFSFSFIYLYDLIADKINFKKTMREVVLTLIFVGFCIPNVFAIRLEMFKGKMANTFLIYDYIRVSNLIKDDIVAHNPDRLIKAEDISIKGIKPMSFNVDEYWYPPSDSHLRFDSFKYVFGQTFNDKSAVYLKVNNAEGRLGYSVEDLNIYNSAGSNIDIFSSYFDNGLKELKSGNEDAASIMFKKAIEKKPFFLNYILAGHKLEYLVRSTGRKDLKSWIGDIVKHYTIEYYKDDNKNEKYHVEKVKYVTSTIGLEIDEYIECLFYEAYLDHVRGKDAESKYFVSQIKLLESNYYQLFSFLSKKPLISSDRKMLDFLHGMNSAGLPVKRLE